MTHEFDIPHLKTQFSPEGKSADISRHVPPNVDSTYQRYYPSAGVAFCELVSRVEILNSVKNLCKCLQN
jgi:hypothetical protein